MYGLTAAARSYLDQHHGVITTGQLVEAGIKPDAITRLVRSGQLTRRTRGIFVLPGVEETLLHRCAVLCSTYPKGFVTGPTAGMLAGLRRMPVTAALHFSLPHGIHPEPENGVRYRQSTCVRPADRHTRDDGIVVASWTRLAFDLAADLRLLDHRSVVEQLLDQRRVTKESLAAIGERLCHPGRPGSIRFVRTLSTLGSSAPQDSHGEVVLLDALRARGVPAEQQVAVGVLHVDLGVAAVRWGVELDVHPEHRTLEGHRQDADRRRLTNDEDWQVEVVTELDMRDVPALADRLAVNYTRRRRRLESRPSTEPGFLRSSVLGAS